MSSHKSQFSSPDAWRDEAMARTVEVNTGESLRRKMLADAHNEREGITDPDTLADQQLYILGKMELGEYQDYLLFKHSKP